MKNGVCKMKQAGCRQKDEEIRLRNAFIHYAPSGGGQP